MVDIAGLLRPIKKSNVDGIEELAARLAAGVEVPPEEVEVVLDRTNCDIDDLQAAVDRHERVLGLRAQAADAEPLRKRLAGIESTVTAAEAEFFAAKKKLDAAIAKAGDEPLDLRLRIEAADRAKKQLLDPENLPPAEADRLRLARQAADEADSRLTEARQAVEEGRGRLHRAEADLPDAEQAAKAAPNSADAQAAAARARTAVASRREQLTQAEEELQVAEAMLAASRRERAAVEIAVARAAGVS
jgi:hypothetical protein